MVIATHATDCATTYLMLCYLSMFDLRGSSFYFGVFKIGMLTSVVPAKCAEEVTYNHVQEVEYECLLVLIVVLLNK